MAAPPVTITPLKVPASCNIVYVPFGTLVNVKFMLPSAPQVAGLLPAAKSVGADGAVMVTFTPAAEAQPPVVMDRLL